jgi:hypothetical protein
MPSKALMSRWAMPCSFRCWAVQIPHHSLGLIRAAGLAVGGMGKIVAGDLQRPPAVAAMRHCLEVPGDAERYFRGHAD